MRYIFILVILVFASCNEKEKDDLSDVTYRIILKDNDKYSSYLSENIEREIDKNSHNERIKKYDSLTKIYLSYLDKIRLEISQRSAEIFFEKESYSLTGKELIVNTNHYKSELEKLVISKNLRTRINFILNTNDLKLQQGDISENNEESKFELNTYYAKYLDYYYREFSNHQVLAYLSNKKRSILEMENEFVLSFRE